MFEVSTSADDATMESLPELGDVIDGTYELIDVLGTGGFGAVYRARQLNMDRDVALKMLIASGPKFEEMVKRFRREVMAIRNLTHPNTVRIYDFHDDPDGMLYYTMEALDGHTLKDEVSSGGPIAPRRLRRILRQVLKSLSEAHSYKIVHRDLKPANIMLVDMHGEQDFVKVLDFGIAKMLDDRNEDGERIEQLTSAGILVGTIRYMSPEQIAGEELGPHTDLYALGLIALEMLTGESVFAGTGRWEVLQQQISDDPVEIPDPVWNSGLGPMIGRCLRKDRERRAGKADVVLEMLNSIDDSALDDEPLFVAGEQDQWIARDNELYERNQASRDGAEADDFEELKTQVMDEREAGAKTEIVSSPEGLEAEKTVVEGKTEVSESPFEVDAGATLEMDSVADEETEPVSPTPAVANSQSSAQNVANGRSKASAQSRQPADEPIAERRSESPDETGSTAVSLEAPANEPGRRPQEQVQWSDPPDEDKSKQTMLFAAVAVALLITAGFGVWQLVMSDDDSSPAEELPAQAVVDDAESDGHGEADERPSEVSDDEDHRAPEDDTGEDSGHEVEISVANDGVSAEVFVEDERRGTTPYTVTFDDQVVIRLEAEDFQPLEARVGEQTSAQVEVELEPIDEDDERAGDAVADRGAQQPQQDEPDEVGAPTDDSGSRQPGAQESPSADQEPDPQVDSGGDISASEDSEDQPVEEEPQVAEPEEPDEEDGEDDGWVDITGGDGESAADEDEEDDDVPLF